VILVEEVFFIEINDKYLVLRITGLYEVDGGGVHRRPLLAHGTGVVDDNAHRHRNIFPAEQGYLLGLAVFEDGEIVAREIGDQAIVIVDHGGVQHNFVHFPLEDIDAALFGIGRLALGRILHSPRLRTFPPKQRKLGWGNRWRTLSGQPSPQQQNKYTHQPDPISIIRWAHNIPFWRTRAAAAGLWADSVSP